MDTALKNVSIHLKANVYFDGGCISHTVTTPEGERKTVGVIRPGSYHFTTNAPERMDIVAGAGRIKLAGESQFRPVKTGESFHVPGKSAFDIAVDEGLLEYLCSFGT